MYSHCVTCNKSWNFPVEKCIFCGEIVENVEECSIYKVFGFSEVQVPSVENEKVPYFVYFLIDKKGNKIFRKSFNRYQIGDIFKLEYEKIENFTVGVIGTGLLGSQISEYMLVYGYPTVIKTRSEDSKKQIRDKLEKKLSKKFTESEVNACLRNLEITTDYSHLVSCDLIIEASAEDLEIKRNIFKEVSTACTRDTIFATNTSSLSIDKLAKATDRPGMFIGMHFFNPVHKMNLVEIIVGEQTLPETIETIKKFTTKINKKPIIVMNSPGFVVNRYLLPQINEAIKMVEEGIASKEDIDSAIKLGLNHPMGPLELADFIGLDICLSILEVLTKGFKSEHFKPAKLLRQKVSEGKLGYKSGEGFYSWR